MNSKNANTTLIRITSLILFIFGTVFSAWANSSVNVPLDSWVYPALEKLESYGLIDSALSSTKPYSRLESARLVKEAMEKWGKVSAQKKPFSFAEKDLIPSLLDRLKIMFKAELVEWGALEGSPASTYLKPLSEMKLKYQFQSDNPITRPQQRLPSRETIYSIYNNDGIVYRAHNNFTAEAAGEGRLWNHFSLYYRPIFKAFEGEGPEVVLEKGYLKAEGFNIELEAGRDSLWWGSARHGGLLMTNNARPFDLLKLSNPQPFVLPILGPFKFNVFLAQLDYGEPFIAKPWLYGLHLNFKPLPILEFGLSQITIFSGEGRRALDFVDYVKILYSRTDSGTKLATNQMGAADFSVRWPNFDRILPIFRSLKFYGEAGMDDPPDKWAYILGLYLNDLFLTGRVDLRVEYASTAVSRAVPGAWYTHDEYPPIFHDRIFGHHVGSNADDIFARLTGYLSPKLTLGLDFNLETQGKIREATTQSRQWGTDLEYQVSDQLRVKGRYIFENFTDDQRIAGGNQTQQFLGLEVLYGH